MTLLNIGKRSDIWLFGVDIGSTTIKIVLMDFQKQLRYLKYLRHNAEIYLTILSVLHNIHAIYGNIPLHICIIGSIGMGLAETYYFPFLQEVVAATF